MSCRPLPETGEGSGHGGFDKTAESLTNVLEGMGAMMK